MSLLGIMFVIELFRGIAVDDRRMSSVLCIDDVGLFVLPLTMIPLWQSMFVVPFTCID